MYNKFTFVYFPLQHKALYLEKKIFVFSYCILLNPTTATLGTKENVFTPSQKWMKICQ